MKVPNIEDVIKVVRLQLGLRDVSPEHRLMEDLGAESADVVNIVATAEEKFNISFDEAEIARVKTVRQLFELVLATN